MTNVILYHIMVYHTIYYHVALQSADTFKRLVKAIPDLYRWVKRDNNRDIIIRHFIHEKIIHKYGDSKIQHKRLIGTREHSVDDIPALIEYIIPEELNEKFKNMSYHELKKIDFCNIPNLLGVSKIWRKFGHSNRDNDLPAVIRSLEYIEDKLIYYSNIKKWFKNGRLHRENDAPAIIIYGRYKQLSDNTGHWHLQHIKKWYKNGLRHRDNDKPAFMDKYGSSNKQELFVGQGEVYWYLNDQLTRRDGGTSVPVGIRKREIWYLSGQKDQNGKATLIKHYNSTKFMIDDLFSRYFN